MLKRFDAIIVGGGPAGSTCARALTAGGLRVALLDRKEFPRDKVCAGWVTPAVLAALEVTPDEYASSHVLQPIRAFRTGLIGDPEPITTRYDDTISYGIRRYEFDNWLLRRSGAELLLGVPLTTLHRTRGEWEVNNRWRAPLLVGAGGHYCPVARHLGAEVGRGESPVTAQEIEFRLDDSQRSACAVRGDTPELYFCRDLRGYGWCFRKGEWLNVGFGREGKGNLTEHVDAFLQYLQEAGRVPPLAERLHGHAYLLYRRPAPRPRYDEAVMLVGDAAGLAYPQSGEGIRPAVESALLAAEVILAAGGRFGASRLAAYDERLSARFGPGEAGRPPGLVRRWVGRSLLASRAFTRHVLLDRWFLHRHQLPLRA
jgi:geranylgeranyl reductase family protein